MSNVIWNIKRNFCFDLLSIPRQGQQVRTGAKFGTRDSWKTRNGLAVQANKRVEYTRGGGHLFRRQSFSVPSHIGYRQRCIEPIPIRLGAVCGIWKVSSHRCGWLYWYASQSESSVQIRNPTKLPCVPWGYKMCHARCNAHDHKVRREWSPQSCTENSERKTSVQSVPTAIGRKLYSKGIEKTEISVWPASERIWIEKRNRWTGIVIRNISASSYRW